MPNFEKHNSNVLNISETDKIFIAQFIISLKFIRLIRHADSAEAQLAAVLRQLDVSVAESAESEVGNLKNGVASKHKAEFEQLRRLLLAMGSTEADKLGALGGAVLS